MKPEQNKNNSVEILIAEDSATQREQLRGLLEEHGYAVTAASNGREALETMRQHAPTIVISDIVMPELDGYGLCRAIKSDEGLKHIPVMLVTTLSDPLDIIMGLECGADNFIRKPYEEKYLLSRLDYLLMNLELRKHQKVRIGVEISLGNRRHFITAERQQMLDLLISIYEQAVRINDDLKARERELLHSNQVLNGLYRIAEGLNTAVSQQAVGEVALKRAMEIPGVQAGWISLREGESGFRLLAARNLPPALERPGAMEGTCACRRKLLSGELDSVTNILECERLGKAKGGTRGLRVHASVPLWLGGEMLGVMNLAGPNEGLFDEGELEMLYGIGHEVAAALERAKLHERLEQLVEERTAALKAEIEVRKKHEHRIERLNRVYAVLSGINTAIVRIRDRQALFDEACCIAVEHGGFTFAWIGLLDTGTRKVNPVAKAGRDEDYLGQINLSADEGAEGNCELTAQALTRTVPVVCNDIQSDERMKTWRAEALKRGYRSIALLPLVVEGRPVGVFVIYAPEPGVFDEEEMKLLVEMAGDIAFALDHIEKEERLHYLAYFDTVTGLANRALFQDRLDQRAISARRDASAFSVVMLDLDRFRSVNESLGQAAGDDLLREVARRLKGALGDTDILARVGGNTFGIVTLHAGAAGDAARVPQQFSSCIRERPFTVREKELRLGAKIGIALFPADGADAETLYRNAEAALKEAKRAGLPYQFYESRMNAMVSERLALEGRLRKALENEEFVLHYQPKVSLATGRIASVEALIRWRDPDADLVPPGKFVSVLEETGLIIEAGQWAIKRALTDLGKWRSAGTGPMRVAVNISPVQLRYEGFVPGVEQAIRDAKGEATGLDLEITESLVMEDIETNISKLKALRALGVAIAIDDFGTGYSSLSYIVRLPVNTLKIDRAFVANMTNSPDDMNVVATIISLAHSMNLKVVAEGVETEDQARLLRLLKCDEIQGYLFSPAVPAEQMEQMLREDKALVV